MRFMRRFVIVGWLLALLTSALSVGSPTALAAGGPLLYGVSIFGDDVARVQRFDPATGELAGAPSAIVVAGGAVTGTVDGANALAADPTTGTAYVVLRMNSQAGNRILATIDLLTGDATTIGDTGRRMSSITFTSGGILYGVTGDGDPTCGACLYEINKADATITLRKALLTGPGTRTAGEVIVHNPDDSLLYHFSGYDDGALFEKINPGDGFSQTTISVSGDAPPREPIGAAYDPTSHTFFVGDFGQTSNGGDVLRITTGGVVRKLSTIPYREEFTNYRGYVIRESTAPVAVDDTKSVARNAGPTDLDVLANDVDGTATPVSSIASVSDPPHGITTNQVVRVRYTPDPGHCNSNVGGLDTFDKFTYTLAGGSEATVRVRIVCPEVARSLTLRYSAARNRFRGTLSSTEPACVANQLVEIFRVTSDPLDNDKFIADESTDADGKFVSKRKNDPRPGRYYARVDLGSATSVADCSAAQSPFLRIR